MWRPVVVTILDGWGIAECSRGNPLSLAKLPTIQKLDKYYPHIAVQASGISVGLPWGEPGNSEVGHMSLGTGKVIYQNMPRITMSIQSGEFFKNPALLKAVEHARTNNSSLHLMGLVGKGSIHSYVDHLYALLELARDQKLENVFIHVFTDGRDSSPTSGLESIRELKKKIETYGVGQIATIGGRYYGMDRNNNWDRIQKSYDTMVRGIGATTPDPEQYLQESYAKEVYDEYIDPALVVDANGQPLTKIKDNDSVIFFNFREDRARQISQAFTVPSFSKFSIEKINNLMYVGMVMYEEDLPMEVAFGPIEIKNSLGEVLSRNKLTQLRISETEKFAHVTYFFNGGNEEPFIGEDRVIIPSKNVASFDLAPEMSAQEITDKVVDAVEKEKYDFILINYPNPDIVGHTGVEPACIKAVETVDNMLSQIVPKVLSKGGCMLISADHGNVEEIINSRTGEIDTEHSVNPVPLWYVTPDNHYDQPQESYVLKVGGLLSDIAPTVLDILGLPKPPEMSGESLLPILK
jgi:2,3-bisphosphoglycerate-independent phosphoglycerate mutase